MAHKPIPEELKRFIIENIDSIAELEALLLLRAGAGQEWTARAVAERLYISDHEARGILEKLLSRGFLSVRKDEAPLYRYVPVSAGIAHMTDQLADSYAKYLVPITHIVHSKKNRIQEFADAFWIRKDDR